MNEKYLELYAMLSSKELFRTVIVVGMKISMKPVKILRIQIMTDTSESLCLVAKESCFMNWLSSTFEYFFRYY